MKYDKGRHIDLATKCTCSFLAGAILVASVVEILDCPIHGNKSCQTQHIEQPYVSLGTISASATSS